MIENLITPDFIDFVQRGSIEFEVWGKRPNKITTAGHHSHHHHHHADGLMGDPDVGMSGGDGGSEDGSSQGGMAENTNEVATLRNEIERLNDALEKKNREVRTLRGELETVNRAKEALKSDLVKANGKSGMFTSSKKIKERDPSSFTDTSSGGGGTAGAGGGPEDGSKACRIS